MHDNLTDIINLIKSFAGQANVLTVPRTFVELTGNVEAALFLSQCVYWSDRSATPGVFYKSYAEWQAEIGIGRRGIDKCRRLVSRYVTTELHKVRGAPTLHYMVNMEAIATDIIAVHQMSVQMDLREPYKSICANRTNPFARSEQIHSRDSRKSLTETTTESTAETTSEPSSSKPRAEAEIESDTPNSIGSDDDGDLKNVLSALSLNPKTINRLINDYPPDIVQSWVDLYPRALEARFAKSPGWVVNAVTKAWDFERINARVKKLLDGEKPYEDNPLPEDIISKLRQLEWTDDYRELEQIYAVDPNRLTGWLDWILREGKGGPGLLRTILRRGNPPPKTTDATIDLSAWIANRPGSDDDDDDDECDTDEIRPTIIDGSDLPDDVRNAWVYAFSELRRELLLPTGRLSSTGSYLVDIESVSYAEDVFTISMESRLGRDILERQIASRFGHLLTGAMGRQGTTEFIVAGDNGNQED